MQTRTATIAPPRMIEVECADCDGTGRWASEVHFQTLVRHFHGECETCLGFGVIEIEAEDAE